MEDVNVSGESLHDDLFHDKMFKEFDWEYKFIERFSNGQMGCLELIFVEENVTLDPNGSLTIEGDLPSDLYCLENLRNSSDENLMILKCSHEVKMVNEKSDEMTQIWRSVFSGFSVLSAVSLIVTFVVYIIVPGLLNFQGVLVLCNIITMFLATIYILAVFNMRFSMILCSAFATNCAWAECCTWPPTGRTTPST